MIASAPPTWLPVVVENIPHDLTSLRAWYPALIRPKKNKVGQWDKIPADPETATPRANSSRAMALIPAPPIPIRCRRETPDSFGTDRVGMLPSGAEIFSGRARPALGGMDGSSTDFTT